MGLTGGIIPHLGKDLQEQTHRRSTNNYTSKFPHQLNSYHIGKHTFYCSTKGRSQTVSPSLWVSALRKPQRSSAPNGTPCLFPHDFARRTSLSRTASPEHRQQGQRQPALPKQPHHHFCFQRFHRRNSFCVVEKETVPKPKPLETVPDGDCSGLPSPDSRHAHVQPARRRLTNGFPEC